MRLKFDLAGIAALLALAGVLIAFVYDVKIDVAVLKRDVAELRQFLLPNHAAIDRQP